jgi:hypothetical protein
MLSVSLAILAWAIPIGFWLWAKVELHPPITGVSFSRVPDEFLVGALGCIPGASAAGPSLVLSFGDIRGNFQSPSARLLSGVFLALACGFFAWLYTAFR